MLLRKRQRKFVREIARKEYLGVCSLYYNPKQLKGSPKSNVVDQIKISSVEQTERVLRDSQEFKGILTSLLISIAIKLAIKLIEKWIEDNLFEPSTLSKNYSYGEPGYAKGK
tara:strand:- start:28536 stop:28871 length:336 start_codon:yes stop_codon:yes gene_type:complete